MSHGGGCKRNNKAEFGVGRVLARARERRYVLFREDRRVLTGKVTFEQRPEWSE